MVSVSLCANLLVRVSLSANLMVRVSLSANLMVRISVSAMKMSSATGQKLTYIYIYICKPNKDIYMYINLTVGMSVSVN